MDLDFSDVPLVDNHCHGLYREQRPADALAWRRHFTESADLDLPARHAAMTLFYSRLIRALAGFLGCEPTEAAVLAARAERDEDELIAAFLHDAHIDTLLVDQGFPPPERVRPDAEVAALAGLRVLPMLRLETLMQELIAAHDTLDAVEQALRAALADIRASGYVALKSIAAYRTGLAIARWPRDEAQGAFRQARDEVEAKGHLRLAHQPLLDTLLHVAFAAAAEQGVPVQFHTGNGDTDADLRLADPLHLRAVLEDPAYRGMPVVLLHECYPYTREGGYLAAVYGNVYLDLSYGIPFLSLEEMVAFTRAALGVAPTSKLLYSSDGVGVPELHWMSAHDGRCVLGRVLGKAVSSGDLKRGEAEVAGQAILRENAIRLYAL
ncbi:MAG TPA: amidohydrolase family protein [Ktedonobacterales bacterium]